MNKKIILPIFLFIVTLLVLFLLLLVSFRGQKSVSQNSKSVDPAIAQLQKTYPDQKISKSADGSYIVLDTKTKKVLIFRYENGKVFSTDKNK